MPKELAKVHEVRPSRGVSSTPGYSTSTVNVPVAQHKRRRITDKVEFRTPATTKKKETRTAALAGKSINIALAVIENKKITKNKKPKRGKKSAKPKVTSWRPSLETHAEETKRKRKKKKGETDQEEEEEEDLTHIAADAEEEEEEVIEVEEEKE